MKLLIASLALFSFSALAGEHLVCSYQKGQIISLRTGLRVARTFQPKVMDVMRIEGTVEESKMVLQSLMDNFYTAVGNSGCGLDEREGMTCFAMRMVRPVSSEFRAYRNAKQLVLVKNLPVPGGAIQEDEYHCSL